MATGRSGVQRRPQLIVLSIDAGSTVQQDLHHLLIVIYTALHGDKKWGGGGIKICFSNYNVLAGVLSCQISERYRKEGEQKYDRKWESDTVCTWRNTKTKENVKEREEEEELLRQNEGRQQKKKVQKNEKSAGCLSVTKLLIVSIQFKLCETSGVSEVHSFHKMLALGFITFSLMWHTFIKWVLSCCAEAACSTTLITASELWEEAHSSQQQRWTRRP